MEYWLISMLSVVISVFVTYYLFRKFNFFKRHGIIHISSIPILSVMPIIFRRMSFANFTRKIYNLNQDAKYIGFYATMKPVLMLRDPELIKDVIVKNFDSFTNNSIFIDVNDYMLSQNLFGLQNTKWRHVKKLLSPLFTSSKIKNMFILMSKYAADFAELMLTLSANKSDVNMKDIFSRYTNDVIALCMYGMKIDSIRNPTNKFYVCGKAITHVSVILIIKYIFIRTFPKLGQIFNIKLFNNQEMKYFESRIKNEIITRDTEHISHPDMIQLMLANRDKEGRIQMDDIVAQAYAFYFAGSETSSSVMSFITYQIVANPSIQIKLGQEIDKLLNELDGNVTYESINKLKYLDAVIKEALRLCSQSVIERVCEKAYKLPPALPGEKSFTINKGMIIWIPLYAIHHNEKYYDNPEEFRPERFLNNDQDNNDRSSFYFPFGLGSRMCIGRRFSLLMIKVVLFHLLARCELKQCAKTSSIKFERKKSATERRFWLNIQHKNDKYNRD